MSFQIGVRASAIGDGIWAAEILHDDLKRLGKPRVSVGKRTVLGIKTARYIDGSLFFDRNDVSVFNVGWSNDAVLVDIGESKERLPAALRTEQSLSGDAAFISECKKHLSPGVATLAQDLMAEVRQNFPGRMHEGNARKWVNYPSNFLAITIQNRDQSLAIHVKGEPDKHPNTPLDLRRDRPSYSRFKISKSSDLTPALEIIKRSAML